MSGLRRSCHLFLPALACATLMAQVAYGFDVKPRIPADATVMQAAPDLPLAQTKFLGRWEGSLIGHKGQIQHALVVERVYGKTARVLWVTGDSTATNAAAFRVDAGFVKEGELWVTTAGWPTEYHMKPDGDIDVIYRYYGSKLVGKLRKVDTPLLAFDPNEVRATNWPVGVGQMPYRESSSAVKAELPTDLPLSPASASAAPPELAAWLGRWGGASCGRAACDSKLAVLSIGSDQATVVARYVAPNGKQIMSEGPLQARIERGELKIENRKTGHLLVYRLRGNDLVEVYRTRVDGRFEWGVMKREP